MPPFTCPRVPLSPRLRWSHAVDRLCSAITDLLSSPPFPQSAPSKSSSSTSSSTHTTARTTSTEGPTKHPLSPVIAKGPFASVAARANGYGIQANRLWASNAEDKKKKNNNNNNKMTTERTMNALAMLRLAAQVQPLDYRGYARLGASLKRRGRIGEAGEAVKAFRRALFLNGSDVESMVNIGVLLLTLSTSSLSPSSSLSDWKEEGLQYLVKANSLSPRHLGALYNLAAAKKLQKQYNAAMKLLRRAVQEDHRFTQALVLGSSVLRAQKRVGEAAGWLLASLDIDLLNYKSRSDGDHGWWVVNE